MSDLPPAQPKKKFIFHSHINYMSVLLIVIGVIIGLFFTLQWRTEPTRATDPVINYSSLIQTKDKLVKEQEALKASIAKLNQQSSDAQKTLKLYGNSKELVSEVEADEQKIGLTEYKGSGVVITLDDSKQTNSNVQSIVHAADLRDLVNYLWGAGAKAISINNERVVFNTSIDCIVNTILINSTKTAPPFETKAIGDKDYLLQSLSNEGYLKDLHQRIDEEGVIYSFSGSDNIAIPAYNGSLKVDYAKVK